MTVDEAAELLERTIAPLAMNVFLNDVLDRRFILVDADPSGKRSGLLGPNPQQALLNQYARLSRSFGFHADGPTGPAPEIRPAASAEEFKKLVYAFHNRGWTVRLDGVSALNPALRDFVRALAVHFAAPVSSSVFWSRAGGLAPVHHDGYDIICIQLEGRKRWTVATNSVLPNEWAPQSPDASRLNESETFDVKPGDLIYIPRGTAHKVHALEESLHVSIGFTPPTLREALIACVDFASDRVRPLRESIGARAGSQALSSEFGDVPGKVRHAATAIADYCNQPGFIAEALRARAARAVRAFELEQAEPRDPGDALTAHAYVRRRPLVACQVCIADDRLEFAFPGGRELVHPSMLMGLQFIASTSRFRVGDIPDVADDEVRVALVRRLIERGVLELDA
jgi:bifunctional lysine-specific demethylase and histidyl-hydroxylase MINA